jgi:hypothetical protein
LAAWYAAIPAVPPTRPPIEENCRKCPARRGPEDRQRGTRDVDDTEQVGLDLRPEVGRIHVPDSGRVGVAGIVGHDVERAELLDAGRDRGPGGRCVGDVQRHRADLAAVLRGEPVQLPGPAGRGYDVVAGLQRGLGQFVAEAAAAKHSGLPPLTGEISGHRGHTGR